MALAELILQRLVQLREHMGGLVRPPGRQERDAAGWLFTVLAVSLGTRFWFDTLDKLVSIRSGVKPKEEDKKDS